MYQMNLYYEQKVNAAHKLAARGWDVEEVIAEVSRDRQAFTEFLRDHRGFQNSPHIAA